MTIVPTAVTNQPTDRGCVFSFATLVSDRSEFERMIASFEAGGFGGADCEYLYVDNTAGNSMDAYTGLNRMLDAARGRYVVLCHQDLRLIDDGRAILESRLADLDELDPSWALAGNAGGIAPGRLAVRLTDPHKADQNTGTFPARVHSLDENFIVVRSEARLALSHDLSGFHFYGTDICLQAELAGWHAYVIDFHLNHLSPGRKSPEFFDCRRALREKYAHALRPRWVQTTCALVPIAAGALSGAAGGPVADLYARIAKRLPGNSGWTRPERTAAGRK